MQLPLKICLEPSSVSCLACVWGGGTDDMSLDGLFCSAEGLSVSAQIMELITYNVTVAYNMRLGEKFPRLALSPESH